MDKEDILGGICGDIVALRRLEPCLAKLRAGPKGVWQELRRVCAEDEAALRELEKVGTDADATYATWLPFPDSVYGTGFITIIFFVNHFTGTASPCLTPSVSGQLSNNDSASLSPTNLAYVELID